MQELGMNSLAALGAMFPDLDESEKRRMLSGIPFRLSKELVGLMQQMLALYQGFMQTPDVTIPIDPAIGQPAPLAVTMGAPIKELMQKVIAALQQEYSYGHEYRMADTNFESQNNVASSLSTTGASGSSDPNAPANSAGGSSTAPTESESTAILFDWGNSPVLPGAASRTPGVGSSYNPDGSSAFASLPRAAANATGGTIQPPISPAI
jgi:hypothetical protein